MVGRRIHDNNPGYAESAVVLIAVMISNHSMMRLAIDCFSMDISSESVVRMLHPGSTEMADKGNSAEDNVAAAEEARNK